MTEHDSYLDRLVKRGCDFRTALAVLDDLLLRERSSDLNASITEFLEATGTNPAGLGVTKILQKRGWVLREQLGWHHPDLRRTKNLSETERKALAAVDSNGSSASDWAKSSDLPRRTFYRAKAALIDLGSVVEIGGKAYPL